MSRAVKYNEFGPASVLRVENLDAPKPKAGKVRIAVKAAGINPSDSKTREGVMHGPSFTFPAGTGRELAGIVESVGEGVGELSVGDEVFGLVASGAVADLAVTNPANLARKPAGLDWATAGALSLAGQTAFNAVRSQSITASDVVLVSAATGGVGVIAAQLARLAGATVIGTASEANHEFLESLGVIPVSYADAAGTTLADRVRSVAPGPVTVVLDQHGRDTIQAGFDLGVAPGRINTIAADAADYGVEGVGRGPIDTATLATLAGLVVDGSLVVPIAATFPIEETRAAFELLDGGHVRGKVVIVF
ncbi:NADPH:quinone reductase-like Zn-dependent oxidoreductase [Conyzicola lurida]|uniref:NADPH:quinone reductase-like Zn-dependent oxidoreductase n=1 Tax=Conyzicola lurida TaxID=1172621 RepID=A0A841AMK7_9MICO|nr:NADP-dependent oxidoreductase [Conyzicola lurida]MBB5842765.1 NADPH:quinone reductase-like Zn-dependent oxidoreductase [Conyzicola lurida]